MGAVKKIFLIIVCACLQACAPPPKVEVVERVIVSRAVEVDKIGGNLVRFVQPNDTLHGIAFSADLNVNDVAAWNGIEDTANLQIGQRIRLTKPLNFSPPITSDVVDGESIPLSDLNDYQSEVLTNAANPRTFNPAFNETVRAETIESTIENTSIVENEIVTNANQPGSHVQAVEARNDNQVLLSNVPPAWQWPLQGEVIRGFSQNLGRDGIDIKAELGGAVNAASAGQVVYAGNSLKGYGNLVIVKHNDTYLSAYAHNSEVYVREGEVVAAKQRIGSVGKNRLKESALHFQIRKNGQPVNPLKYLSIGN